MIPSTIRAMLDEKQFYKLTGWGHHWLTAIKYQTWGLRPEHLGRWNAMKPGDIFVLHASRSKEFPKAKSGIIGFAVAGSDFRQKTNLLWQEEVDEQENIYPLLVPFSEIYLFSETGDLTAWNPSDKMQTEYYLNQLLEAAPPLPKSFPAQGSMTRIKSETALELLDRGLPSHLIEGDFDLDAYRSKVTPLEPFKSAVSGLRAIPTLKYLNQPVSTKKIGTQISTFERNNELLERANTEHQQVIEAAATILKTQGYTPFTNMHTDLVAENEKEILLYEAKSLPENKFRIQARRALGQLYQYQYYDIQAHQKEQGSSKPVKKLLLVPHDPGDGDYVQFLKWANIESVIPIGTTLRHLT
jgi:hypothetical protein